MNNSREDHDHTHAFYEHGHAGHDRDRRIEPPHVGLANHDDRRIGPPHVGLPDRDHDQDPPHVGLAERTDHTNELELPTERLTHAIIGCAIEVHRHLGPGLFEAIYERAMQHELRTREIPYRSQVAIPMLYKGEPVGDYFADLIIANRVIVELKAVSALHNAHVTQVLSYLRSTNLRLGLLVNFNAPVLVKGVKRVIR